MSSVNTTTINTICKNVNCEYDLSQFSATVEIDREHRLLSCPVCGSLVQEITDIADKDIFYDRNSGVFYKWASTTQASAQPDIIEQIPLGNLTIRIQAKPFDYRKLFYNAVLVFIKDDNHSAYPNELVAQQIFAPPENCRQYGIEIVSATMQTNGNYLEVKFRLKGSSNEFFIVLPAAATKPVPNKDINLTNSSWLKVWPDFKRPSWSDLSNNEYQGWADYFVYFDTKDASITPDTMRVIGENPGENTIIARNKAKAPIKGDLNFPPEYIEVSATVNTSGNLKMHNACFKVELTPCKKATGSTPLRLSIDFGTSNTCFCYSVPDQRKGLWTDPMTLELNDHSVTIVEGMQSSSGMTSTWFPSLNSQTLLPSELMFFEDPLEAMTRAKDLRPVADYIIPGLTWRKEEEAFISTGFKWEHATEPRDLRGSQEDLQRMYLGMAFRLALAELAPNVLSSSSVHPCRVELFITYPLSMTEAEFKRLHRSYDYVREEVNNRTGINIEARGFIDESYAAEKGHLVGKGTHKIYVDVGGGTTDVSVVEVFAEQGVERTAQIVDSVGYAGNDYLMVLANDDPATQPGGGKAGTSQSKDKKRPGGKISTKSLIELQRRIRSDKEGLLKDISTFGGNKMRQDEALVALERFLEGLLEYIGRLVAWKTNDLVDRLGDPAKDEVLNIYLVGNGWRFILFLPRTTRHNQLQDPRDFIKGEVESRLHKVLDKLVTEQIMKIKPRFSVEHPDDPKTVVARGALKPWTQGGSNFEKQEPQSILGNDITVIVPAGEKHYEWNKSVPFEVDDGISVQTITMTRLTAFEQLTVPPDHTSSHLRPINEIDIVQQVYSDEERRIIRSVFNVYLERWHKRFLHPKGWF